MLVVIEEHRHEGRHTANGGRENNRHNTRHNQFDGDITGLTSGCFVPYIFTGILNRNATLCIACENDIEGSCQNKEDDAGNHQIIPPSIFFAHCNRVLEQRDDSIPSGNDTGKDDKGNTVADAFFVNQPSKPDDDLRTSSQNGNNSNGFHDLRNAGSVFHRTVVLHNKEVPDSCYDRQTTTNILRDFIDLLLPADVLADFFQFRNRNSQKLDDDACVDVCRYANRKYRTLRKCATGNQIVIIQYRGASEHSLKRSGVYERNRNTATQTINQKTKDGEENLVANIIHH